MIDEEFNEYAIDLLKSIDTLLFGRVTYELMASYWPTPSATTDDPIVAEKMNNLAKIVFSTTLQKVTWSNTRLVKDNSAEEISKLKQQPGKDMVIFGSGSIVSTFTQLGLIDEYWILVNPVVLGSGKTLFKDIRDRVQLKLVKTKTFKKGVVLMYYELEKTDTLR